MRYERITIRGEVFLSLEEVASCYQVELSFLREVYEMGLIGPGELAEGRLAIPARELDRVAEILRLHFHQGVNLAGIALFLGLAEERG